MVTICSCLVVATVATLRTDCSLMTVRINISNIEKLELLCKCLILQQPVRNFASRFKSV